MSADPTRGPAIAAALAAAGLGDVEAPLRRPAFTLRPLLELGPDAIASLPFGPRVRSVSVISELQRVRLHAAGTVHCKLSAGRSKSRA